jgi:hypothetical protein
VARVLKVLKAVVRAAGRGSKSLLSFRSNNLFYAGLVLLSLQDQGGFGFFLVLMVLVLFLPSSGDPMAVVPPERLDLWPFKAAERYGLRVLSPLLNPLAWVILAGMIGIAYLALVLLVTLPLSPAGGLAGGLVALAVGQFASVRHTDPQSRWRLRACSARGYNG